jgi:hypothetical protein
MFNVYQVRPHEFFKTHMVKGASSIADHWQLLILQAVRCFLHGYPSSEALTTGPMQNGVGGGGRINCRLIAAA